MATESAPAEEAVALLPPPQDFSRAEPPLYMPPPTAPPEPAWWTCTGIALNFEIMYLVGFIVVCIVALLCKCLVVELVVLVLAFLSMILGLRTSCILILAFFGIFTYNNWESIEDFFAGLQ